MIRQLEQRCWYVDCDPWEQPHFLTETAALAEEAEAAAACEREPGALLRTAGPCWAAECDRCGRGLVDEDDTWGQVHYPTGCQVIGALDAAGWRVVTAGRVCCPGCAAARPPLGRVTRLRVTVAEHGVWREVIGEATACPQLAVTPLCGRDHSEPWAGVVLAHLRTGRCLPLQALTDDVGLLHRIAELVTGLDWSSPDPAHYATGYAEPVLAAVRQASREHTHPQAGRGGGGRAGS